MIFKLAKREIFRNWRFSLSFILNLTLGLTGFLTLEAFKEAISTRVESNARQILSADLAVGARRQITEEELRVVRETLPGDYEESLVYEFFAMAKGPSSSRLILVKAVDDKYPLYGSLNLDRSRVVESASSKQELREGKAWIYPELANQMGLQVGSPLEIGELKLTVEHLVEKDETQTFRAATMAPRVFIHRDLLAKSGLIQFGSTFSMAYLYKWNQVPELAPLREQLFDRLSDPALQVDIPDTAGEDAGRQLGYLADYLGLVALVALFLSSLGASYIYRLFLSRRLKEIAVYRTLGLQRGAALWTYVIQAVGLGFIAFIPTYILASLFLPALQSMLQRFIPFDLIPEVGMRSVLVGLIMASIGSLAVCFPLMWQIRRLQPAKLFSEEKFQAQIGRAPFWTYLPMALLFWGLAIYQANSFKIGSLFMASLVAVVLILAGFAWASVQVLRFVKNVKRWNWRFAILGVRRRRASSAAIFIAIGVGALLVNILPQLKTSLQEEFLVDESSKLPSLFMFDIQDEQMQELKTFVKDESLEFVSVSPMIRARILSVNGEEFERRIEEGQSFKTREEEAEARFRNRGVNLSYRDQLSESETIVEGTDFSGPYSNPDLPAEVSVEERFADRLGLQLGDQLIFDVQGVEVAAKVINFRKVRWASFQPNFFILLQPGVLDDAPKTFIAALPALAADKREALQNVLAQKYANISIIDVARLVQDILEVAEQMSWSLELMAFLALVTGYIVLFSIVRSQVRSRRWEINMLKILGAGYSQMRTYIVIEFVGLSLFAAVIGSFLSLFVSIGLSLFLFEGSYKLNWTVPLVSTLIIVGISWAIALYASRDILKEKPLKILREDG